MSPSTLISDISELRRLRGYSSIFHEQIIPQHSQFYLFNKNFKLKDCIEFDTEIYRPLNYANLLLGRLCKKMIIDVKTVGIDAKVATELDTLLLNWQECHRNGGVYNSFTHAAKIFTILTDSGIPVKEAIARDEEITRSFIEVPFELKSQFHLGILIKDEDTATVFENLLDRFLTDVTLPYYILEVKISAPVKLETRGIQRYRKIKFLLNPKIVNNKRNPIIGEISSLLQGVDEVVDQHKNECFTIVNRCVTVSQGSWNYKMFLQLLEIIHLVYSCEDNFAYLIDELASDQIVPSNN